MKGKPCVSVIIPTYNRAKLLIQSLGSVYGQDGAGEQFDIEIIVIDDASSDNTAETLKGFPDIKYLRFEENRGMAAARNAGIRVSSGKYIAFLDDDDLWLPHRLRVQIPVLEKSPEIGVVYGQGIVIGENVDGMIWPETRWGVSGRVFETFLCQDMNDVFNIDTLLVRREAFDKAGYFDESLPTMEHHDLCLRLAFHYPFFFIPNPVAVGRLSKKGQHAMSIGNRKFQLIYPQIVEKALAMLPETEEYVELRKKARTAIFSVIADQEWREGMIDEMQNWLLTTLEKHPWMVRERVVMENLRRIVRGFVGTKRYPLSFVKELGMKVKAAAGNQGFKGHWMVRKLLGDLFAEATIVLGRNGLPRISGYAAAYSIFHDPTQIGRKAIWKSLARMVWPL